MENLQTIIDEIKLEYAPDKRVALFDISYKNNDSGFILAGETTELLAKDELLKKLELAKISVQDSIKLLPDAELKDKVYGIIYNSVANLRATPTHSAELVTQAILGTPVRVLKQEDGFYLIQTPDKYIAWVDDGLERMTKAEYISWYNADKIIYTKEYGFSYSEPDEKSERVSDLVLANIIEKIGEQGKFTKVKYPNGVEAFVLTSETADYKTWLENAYPTKENIVETAKLFKGNPYMWGGTSAKALDCSGFTKTVFFQHGVILDRDASQQVHKGILVDTENGFDKLETGDLLFFGRKARDGKREKVTHVGIYLKDNEYIHEAGQVKYNSFNKSASNFSEHRLNGFIRARRIITSVGENGIELVKDNKFYNGELK
ncbi:MAG: C40 family peptidase [Bacteroidetes bacterium]|nr:C40 family peptidase [Bacteroidota bacterium]MBU1115284.1 C40 family peptidase [Bacteroidota bacterium]MBU1800160.1 C40 family peptidase [Bacteroidota bacterium]